MKIPISVQKIKIEYETNRSQEIETSVNYLITIEERNKKWIKTFIADRQELIRFRDSVNDELDSETTEEILGVTKEQAKLIDKHYKEDKLCKDCQYKLTYNCNICLLKLQSPLERMLFLELKKAYINFKEQCPLSWTGDFIEIDANKLDLEKVKFHNILTVPDFFIEKKNVKLCIYTDGHTYHERTEEQAKRDRNIDRKLQELGFIVLRYTGKEVRENPKKIIDQIQKWIG